MAGSSALAVTTTRVARGEVVGRVVATGPVKPAREADVTTRVAGVLDSFTLQDGDKVTKGQVVGRLVRTPFLTALTEAESRLAGEAAKVAALERRSATTDEQTAARLRTAEQKLALARSQLTDRRLAAERAMTEAAYGVQRANLQLAKAPDSPELKNELERAEQLHRNAQADLDRLSDPTHPANLQVAVAETELDELRATLKSSTVLTEEMSAAYASLQAARQAVERAREDLAATVVTAPFDGVVQQAHVREGAALAAGTRLITLVAIDTAVVSANIDESDVERVAAGQAARITSPAVAGLRLDGNVVRLLPKATKDTSNATVIPAEIEFRNEGARLRTGMNADVEIVVARKADVVRVPAALVRGKGADRYVFVVEAGVARQRKVTPGVKDGSWVEITEGLSGGEEIVAGPERVLGALKDGQAVEVGGAK